MRNARASRHMRRIQQRPAQQKIHQAQRNLVHHHRGENLVYAQTRLQQTRNAAPNKPCCRPANQGQRQQNQGWQIAKPHTECGGGQRPNNDLPFAPNIDHAAPKCDAYAQTHQQQWRGLGQRLRDAAYVAQRTLYQSAIGFKRVGAQQQQQQDAYQQCDHHRQHRQQYINQFGQK